MSKTSAFPSSVLLFHIDIQSWYKAYITSIFVRLSLYLFFFFQIYSKDIFQYEFMKWYYYYRNVFDFYYIIWVFPFWSELKDVELIKDNQYYLHYLPIVLTRREAENLNIQKKFCEIIQIEKHSIYSANCQLISTSIPNSK